LEVILEVILEVVLEVVLDVVLEVVLEIILQILNVVEIILGNIRLNVASNYTRVLLIPEVLLLRDLLDIIPDNRVLNNSIVMMFL